MQKGFTLAEVLITLGIIGVVAALTIPTLMVNIQGAKYRNQFKKTLSTINQAGRMAQAQYGFGYSDIDVHGYERSKEQKRSANPEHEHSIAAILNGTLKGLRYIGDDGNQNGYDGIPKPADIDDMDLDFYQLADGAIFTISVGDWNAYIDVNGSSPPNKAVKCSNGETQSGNFNEDDVYTPPSPCVVKNSTMGDIFPVIRYNGQFIPYTNAAQYVLDTAK